MVTRYDIQVRSYLLWEVAGKPQSQELEFWLRAEAELEAEAREAPKPWLRLALNVPRVRVFAPPQRITATRVPPRERGLGANAATR
jgi:hypothetical protein